MTRLESRSGNRPGSERQPDGRTSLQARDGLAGWIGGNTLGGVVLQAVRRVDERELRRVAAPDAGLAFRPLTLLALVTYCYAVEIYSSAEIEDLMRRDAAFRAQCGNEFPDWHAIRRFRRENRGAIHRSLVETFRHLINGCSQDGAGPRRDGELGFTRNLNGSPACRDCRCQAELAARGARFPVGDGGFDEQALSDEARRRIETAMWMDHMAIED